MRTHRHAARSPAHRTMLPCIQAHPRCWACGMMLRRRPPGDAGDLTSPSELRYQQSAVTSQQVKSCSSANIECCARKSSATTYFPSSRHPLLLHHSIPSPLHIASSNCHLRLLCFAASIKGLSKEIINPGLRLMLQEAGQIT